MITARSAGLCALAFTIMVGYGIARPSTDSLFLEAHGREGLPLAWLLVAAAVMVVVPLYNRFAVQRSLVKLLGATSLVSAALLVALLIRHQFVDETYSLYVWKDVYIVVMVEIFWTYANTVHLVGEAKRLYGLFNLSGALGHLVGNLAVGPLALHLGTEQTLLVVPPLLVLVWLGTLALTRHTGAGARRKSNTTQSTIPLSAGWGVLRRSRYLVSMLLLVLVVQVVITLIDYSYNGWLEIAYPDTDIRTAINGQVHAAIDVLSMVLNAAAGLILRSLGVSLTLVAIPAVLAATLGAFLFGPRFATAMVTRVASKGMDYSISRATREILYIPLTDAQKRQGKSIIDILGYRVAKGGTSLLLLGLIAMGAGGWVSWLAVGLVVVWIGLAVVLVRMYERRVEEERASRTPPR